LVPTAAAALAGPALKKVHAMNVALITFGSAGDVHPLLALGQALQARGHRTVLLSLPLFADMAQQAGLPFVPVGRDEDFEHTLAHPKLWHPVDGLGVMWRYLLRHSLQPSCAALGALHAQLGLDAIVAPPMAMGARVASERWGLPLLSVYTAATMLRSHQHPLTVADRRVPRWLPSWAVAGVWHALDRFKLEPLVRADLERLRAPLGLPPIQGSIFGQWAHSPHGGLTLFPRWFAHARDWPAQVQEAGFMLYDQDASQGLSAQLAAFLDNGPPPVVFLSGTAQRHAPGFHAAARAACAALGVRAVLLGPTLTEQADRHCCSAPYAPLPLLLPHAAAVVHHGGIGSCAQALQAGIVQGVVPSAYDQFDNAMRTERLGLALSCPMSRLDATRMTDLVQQLLQRPDLRAQAQHWAAQMRPQAWRQAACQAVEGLQR
jgi:rhamnosyltransferase subunit B